MPILAVIVSESSMPQAGGLEFPDHLFYLFNRERRLAAVDYGVTIWAHRSQIPDRIEAVFFTDLCDWHKVMYVDKPTQ